jgi:hypothetical protein
MEVSEDSSRNLNQKLPEDRPVSLQLVSTFSVSTSYFISVTDEKSHGTLRGQNCRFPQYFQTSRIH